MLRNVEKIPDLPAQLADTEHLTTSDTYRPMGLAFGRRNRVSYRRDARPRPLYDNMHFDSYCPWPRLRLTTSINCVDCTSQNVISRGTGVRDESHVGRLLIQACRKYVYHR
jgi:hypothetical protein